MLLRARAVLEGAGAVIGGGDTRAFQPMEEVPGHKHVQLNRTKNPKAEDYAHSTRSAAGVVDARVQILGRTCTVLKRTGL